MTTKITTEQFIAKYLHIVQHFNNIVLRSNKATTQPPEVWMPHHVEVEVCDDVAGQLVFINDSRYNQAACYCDNDNGSCEVMWTNCAVEDRELQVK